MWKVAHNTLEVRPLRRRRSWAPGLLGLVALVALAPLAYEATLVVWSNWSAMTGTYWEPHTPLIDTARVAYASADARFRLGTARLFKDGGWSPSLAVPLGVVWALGIGAILLGRTR